MENYSDQQYSQKAEMNAASCAMSADAPSTDFYAAIISLMAVIFISSVCDPLVTGILISIILGIIILMVRGKIKPVSRTR